MNTKTKDFPLNYAAPKWEELHSFIGVIDGLPECAPSPPPCPPPPQCCNRGEKWFPCTPGAAPHMTDRTHAADVCYDVRRENVKTPETVSNPPPAAPPRRLPGQWSFRTMQAPETISIPPPAALQIVQLQVQVPVVPDGLQFGWPVYIFPQAAAAPPVAAAARPAKTSGAKTKQFRRTADLPHSSPYVKKPPNAFMVFLREQRKSIDPALPSLGSYALNTALGQKWNSLSNEEQSTYYQQAQAESELHQLQNPGWTTSNNYGKKKKRQRS